MDHSILEQLTPVYEFLTSIFMPWGLISLGILGILESLYIVGLFTPGEVFVVAAIMVGTHAKFPLALIVLVYWLGAAIGITLGYYTGYKLKKEGITAFLEKIADTRIGRFAKVDPGLVEDLSQYFDTHGPMTAFFGRFAYGIKGLLPVLAGATGMQLRSFLIPTILGALLHTSLLGLVGYFVQKNLHIAQRLFESIGVFAAITLIFILVLAFLSLRTFRRRRKARYLDRTDFRLSTRILESIKTRKDQPFKSSGFWHDIEILDEVSSTNELALDAFERGQRPPAAFIARSQTQGRGRFARVWASPKGGFYCTLLLRPNQSVGTLSLLTAYAVYKTIQLVLERDGLEHELERVSVKWPNDIHIDRKKLAGILLEQHGNIVLVGIGLNLRKPAIVDEKMLEAAYLSEIWPKASLDDFNENFLLAFEQLYLEWDEDGFDNFKQSFERIEQNQERVVQISNALGEKIDEGIVVGISPNGALLLADSAKTPVDGVNYENVREIFSGEASLKLPSTFGQN